MTYSPISSVVYQNITLIMKSYDFIYGLCHRRLHIIWIGDHFSNNVDTFFFFILNCWLCRVSGFFRRTIRFYIGMHKLQNLKAQIHRVAKKPKVIVENHQQKPLNDPK